jgi:hypothetical protein
MCKRSPSPGTSSPGWTARWWPNDLLLQSDPFRSGPHVNLVWDVGEAQAGFAILTGGMRFTFTYAVQTQEFQSQHGGLHQFGSAAASLKF